MALDRTRTETHLNPVHRQLWDGTYDQQRSNLFNLLIAVALTTPQGKVLVKKLSKYEVDTTNGVTTLKEKEIAQ